MAVPAAFATNPITMPLAIGASLLGGLFGSKNQTATQTQELPDYLKPYGPQFANYGAALTNLPYQPYQYQRVAPFTEDQLQGMDVARNTATAGQPLFGQAQDQLSATMGGQYMNPASNPYLQSTFDAGAGRMADAYAKGTAATTNAMFGRSGSFGGSAHQEVVQGNNRAFGDSLGQFANQLYGNNYQAERGRQMQASQAAPGLAAQQQNFGITNANTLMGIGQAQQGLGQRYMDADYAQFDEARNYPYRQFDTFASMFNPNLGRTQQTSQPGPGALAGATSGLLGGLAFNRMFPQKNPMSAGTLAGTSSVYDPTFGFVPHI